MLSRDDPCKGLPTPPLGSPGESLDAGNSAPARALVAGGQKSERIGERLA